MLSRLEFRSVITRAVTTCAVNICASRRCSCKIANESFVALLVGFQSLESWDIDKFLNGQCWQAYLPGYKTGALTARKWLQCPALDNAMVSQSDQNDVYFLVATHVSS